jgi:hypothetical protein
MNRPDHPSEDERFLIVEINVKPQTFRVKLIAEEWESWDHSERLKWCEEMAAEFDKIHFDYVRIGPST